MHKYILLSLRYIHALLYPIYINIMNLICIHLFLIKKLYICVMIYTYKNIKYMILLLLLKNISEDSCN